MIVRDPIPKWCMIVADRDGVGLKSEHLVMTAPTWRGCTPARSSTSCTAEKQQICADWLPRGGVFEDARAFEGARV